MTSGGDLDDQAACLKPDVATRKLHDLLLEKRIGEPVAPR